MLSVGVILVLFEQLEWNHVTMDREIRALRRGQ